MIRFNLRAWLMLAAALLLAACASKPMPPAKSVEPVRRRCGCKASSTTTTACTARRPADRGGRPRHQEYRATSVTISGSGINWHDLESHFKPGGVGSYSFGANNVVFNSFTKPFDVVMMMDCSQCHPPAALEVLHRYAAKNSAIARSHGAGRCSSCPGPMPTSPR